MRVYIKIALVVLVPACTSPGKNTDIPLETCAKTNLVSTALLCEADTIRSQRVRYSLTGALGGAVVGAGVFAVGGGDPATGAAAGAVTGALAGYWLNERKAIAHEKQSLSARMRELNRRSEVAKQERRREIRALRLEIARARRLADLSTQTQLLENILQADELSRQKFQNSVKGASAMAPGLGLTTDKVVVPKIKGSENNIVVSEACDALVDIGENCRYIV